MSNVHTNWVVQQYINTLRSYQKVKIPTDFYGQIDVIDKLLKNDRSSLIKTLYNFMVNAGTVDYKFETGSTNLDNRLDAWRKDLNKNIGIDIPSGLRSLSEQHLRERWRSSFLVLNIQFQKVDTWWMPTDMWFADGGAINVTGDQSVVGGYNYRIGRNNNKGKPLVNTKTKQYLIRKPYNMWYDQWPTPYLVGNGALYHGLSKELILDKQNDLMSEVIPLMFLSKLGNDISNKEGNLPTEDELKDHEKKIKDMQEAYKAGTTGGFNAGTFPYDVDFKQAVPEIENFMDQKILQPSDKNILSAMGMIEMEGFSKSRQETVLNPKVMVEEVVDAVLDWRDMLTQVAESTWEMNKDKHPKDTNKKIRVVPGLIRAFLTNDDKVLIRSAFDRGSVGHEDFVSILPFDWKTTMERRIGERDGGLDEKLYPHVIMNQEQHPDDPGANPESTKENAPEKKKTEKDVDTAEIEDITQLPRIREILKGNSKVRKILKTETIEEDVCPHCQEVILEKSLYFDSETEEWFHRPCQDKGPIVFAKKHPKEDKKKKKKKSVMAPFDTIDDLPDSVKNVLPVGAQIIFLKAFNAAIEDGKSEEDAFKIAWSVVKKKYKKVPGKDKWVKKSKGSIDSKISFLIDKAINEEKPDA